VGDGKWGLAYKLYRNATVFPAIVSDLCEAPCRSECQRGSDPLAAPDISITGTDLLIGMPKRHGGSSFILNAASTGTPCDHVGREKDMSAGSPRLLAATTPPLYFVGDKAVDIREIETAVVKYAKDKKPEVFRIPPKEQRVAVIGGGLAGLSVALNLAQKAYPVTVFERGEKTLWSWIEHPKYEYFLEEIDLQFSQVTVEFALSHEIEGPDDPALEGFDYVHDATDNSGANAVTAIANGIELSRSIEAYLQTGGWPEDEPDEKPEKHYLDHKGEPSKAIIIPADPEAGYTKEEAISEASRCMGCDCRACMDACIMLGQYNKRPQKIAVEAYSDTKAAPPFSACSLTRETYSCNLCGYCKSVCPVDVDLEKLFHLARTGRTESGKHPKAFHDFWLRDFEWHRIEGAYFTHDDASYLFFPGCKAGARSPHQIRDAAAFLKEHYGAGTLLDCCGAPAYWAGEDELFRQHLDSLREKWESAGKPVFAMACAYCMRLFTEFLPEIELVSIYELLADAASSLANNGHRLLAVFDPCMARDFPEMEAAVRDLAKDMGIELTELPEKNHCCGYGGHMRVANQDLFDTIVERRSSADEAPYLVYCANCAGTFAIEGKEHVHILDLIFPDEHSRDGSFNRQSLSKEPSLLCSLQQLRDNATLTKTAVAEIYGDTIPPPPEKPWDALKVEIPSALAEGMDKRLILADDIREAIYEADRSGEYFILPDGELRQCQLERDAVTIWVQYTKNEVVDVWSHRMRYSDTE